MFPSQQAPFFFGGSQVPSTLMIAPQVRMPNRPVVKQHKMRIVLSK